MAVDEWRSGTVEERLEYSLVKVSDGFCAKAFYLSAFVETALPSKDQCSCYISGTQNRFCFVVSFYSFFFLFALELKRLLMFVSASASGH